MRNHTRLHRALAALFATLTVAGCASLTPPVPAVAPGGPSQAGEGYRLQAGGLETTRHHSALIRELGLTASQVQALRRVTHGTLSLTAPMMSLAHALLRGPEAGPTAFGHGVKDLFRLDAAQDAQTLTQLRAVLTPAQRLQLADAIKRFPALHEQVIARLLSQLTVRGERELGLSIEQQGKLAACLADLERFWQAKQEAYVSAMAQHMIDGDRPRLQATFENLADGFDPGSTASFLASLDAHQRRLLSIRLDRVRLQLVHGLGRLLSRGAGTAGVRR